MDCEKALELMSAELDGMCTEQERAAIGNRRPDAHRLRKRRLRKRRYSSAGVLSGTEIR